MYYNIIILWDHRRICGPSLTEMSLCGAYMYIYIYIYIYTANYIIKQNRDMDHISKDSILTKTTGPDTISTCKHAQCFDELRGPPNVPQPYHKCVLIIRWTRNSGNVRLIRYLAYDGIQDGSEYTATLSSSPHHSEKKLRELNKCNKYINKVYIATDTRPYAAIPGVNSAKACLVSRYLRSS